MSATQIRCVGPKVHNGFYTLNSRRTGEHRTFRIHTQPKDAEFAPSQRILGLLTGPDNESDYSGFAFVDDQGIHVWRSKRGGDALFEQYAEMLWSLTLDAGHSQWAENYQIMLDGRCVRCNRRLTTPESIRSGVGPICEGRE
jgi:hypothetical protein